MDEELTLKERKTLEAFKNRMQNELPPDLKEDPTVYYRFLKARNFNLKNSEIMLRKHISFRKTYDIGNILTNYTAPEVLQEYLVTDFIGHDKDGTPFRYISIGGTDFKGMMKSAKLRDIVKSDIQIIEKDLMNLNETNKKLGKNLTQFGYIYDYDKLTFAKATDKKALELLMLGINIYQDNYPERIKYIYVINTSLSFSILFSVVKHIIASSIMSKVKLFGTDDYQEHLLNLFDPENLPTYLGGKKPCICRNDGVLIPERYYLTKSKKMLSQTSGFKKLTLTRSCTSDISFEVKEPGTAIEWEFETGSGDIEFGLYFREESWNVCENRRIELVPKQRIDTSHEPETGMYKCERPGTYILTFDNSHSWIRSKDVYYRANVINPKDQTHRLLQ